MNSSKKIRTFFSVLAGLLLIGLATNVFAEEKVDIGKIEYDSACAVCHGLNGKGDDAPLKSELVKSVPDLTKLAENNDGIFPYDLVYQIVDGRGTVKAHGSRDMPVWGATFNYQTYLYFEQNPPYNRESIVRSRILALIDYLSRLQEK